MQEVVAEWQGAASGVMVALGRRFCTEVMGELTLKFQPGTMPHYYVVQTLGDLAAANGTYHTPGYLQLYSRLAYTSTYKSESVEQRFPSVCLTRQVNMR